MFHGPMLGASLKGGGGSVEFYASDSVQMTLSIEKQQENSDGEVLMPGPDRLGLGWG